MSLLLDARLFCCFLYELYASNTRLNLLINEISLSKSMEIIFSVLFSWPFICRRKKSPSNNAINRNLYDTVCTLGQLLLQIY